MFTTTVKLSKNFAPPIDKISLKHKENWASLSVLVQVVVWS